MSGIAIALHDAHEKKARRAKYLYALTRMSCPFINFSGPIPRYIGNTGAINTVTTSVRTRWYPLGVQEPSAQRPYFSVRADNHSLTYIKASADPRRTFCSGAYGHRIKEPAMTKRAAAAAIVLLMTTSSLACAAETSSTAGMRQPSAADMNSLTEMRVGVVKAALQMTPDQEKFWPAVEEAIRARAKNRQARLERIAELHDSGAIETLRERNPVEIMQRRADMLVQRGTDLKKLADAWEPLYKTLSPDQKRRMAFASYVTMHGMRDMIEHYGEAYDDDD